MKIRHKLRRLLLAAGLALILLPPVALGGWTAGDLVANQPGHAADLAAFEAVQTQVVEYAASLWDLLPDNREPFAGGLARLAPELDYFVEIRSLENEVLFASPGVSDGQFQTAGAPAVQRAALIHKEGRTLGLAQVWILPQKHETQAQRTLTTGLQIGAGLLALLLLCVVWYVWRAILQPLRALEQATAAVAAGSYDFVVPETRVQELATLSRSFVTMRDRLQAALDRQQALEKSHRKQEASWKESSANNTA